MKYSVIVPVYNAEKTLSACLDSLLEPKRNDVEIILINDGSSDRSEAICKEYMRKEQNIRYISQPNGGVSSARNRGLDEMRGQYVLFVDSDDCVSPFYFEKIEEMLDEYDYDLILFSHIIDNGKKVKKRIHKEYVSGNQEESVKKLGEAIYKKTINSPWNKVYKKSIIDTYNIRFNPQISIGEDKAFNIWYAMYVKTLRVSKETLYRVNTAEISSLSRKKRDDLEEQFKLLNDELNNIMKCGSPDQSLLRYFREALNFCEMRSVYADAKRLHKNDYKLTERMRILSELCDNINRENLSVPDNLFCKIIASTIRYRLLFVIDLVTWKLVH